MNKKILFVDDEATLHKTFGDALLKEGFEVVSALNGEDGLRLAKDTQPDLILLDLLMPGMNGIEVLRKLKGEDETKSIPVIVLTNSEEMRDIQEAVDLGATTYLVKINYNLEEVVKKVTDSIEAGEGAE